MSYISQTYNFQLNEEQQEKIDLFISYKPDFIKKNFNNPNKPLDSHYINNVKSYFKRIQKNKYSVNDKYSFSDSGRMFSSSIDRDGRSIQGLSNELRSYLLNDMAYDIDMRNACFNFVKYIINIHFPNKKDEFKKIFDYANKRELYFRNGFNKLKYISILFGRNTKPKNFNTFDTDIQILIKEIMKFKQLIDDNLQIFSHINFKENQHIGSKMSYIIFNLENELLQKILKEYQTITLAPVFDGLILKKDINLENTLKHINEIGKEYQIEFTNKEFPLIQIDEKPPDYNIEYKKIKEDFEKNHLIICSPLKYVHIENKEISYYNKRDFMDLVAPYQLEDKPFFNEWIKDPERLSYKKIEFYPNLEKANPEYFNTFTGFKTQKIDNPDMEKVNKFLDLLNLLTNFEEKGKEYLIKYIAHMFQKPEELPLTAILIKSEEGVGKDLLLNILECCIGKEYTHRDGTMENVFGTFNSSSEGKIFIQLNEVCGSDGHFNKDKLKDLITIQDLNIRKMRTDIEKFKNFCRLFLFTNNINPINIAPGDRRYIVFKAGNKQEREYYDILYDIVKYKDKDGLNSIYTYFMNYDISNFQPSDPKDRVITKAYLDMKMSNSNPIYEFLSEMVNNPKKYKIIQQKGKTKIITSQFEGHYTNFLLKNYSHIESNSRRNKSLILDLGAEDTKFYIINKGRKKQVRGYNIPDLDIFKDNIKKYYIEEDDELETFELDDDLEISDIFADEKDND